MIEDAKNPKWADVNKTKIVVDVLFEGRTEFTSFVASPADVHDYGRTLFKLAEKGRFGEVQDSDEERILRGELPVPEGYKLIGKTLYNTEAEAAKVRAAVEQQLSQLYSGTAMAKADNDPEYAENRQAQIASLVGIEAQPGFPFDIEWPEVL